MTPESGRPLSPVDESTLSGQWGAHFRSLRTKVFSTQLEFMEALEGHGVIVNQRTVSNWEHGWRCPHITILPYIALTLGVSVFHLLPDSFKKPPKLHQPILIDRTRRTKRPVKKSPRRRD